MCVCVCVFATMFFIVYPCTVAILTCGALCGVRRRVRARELARFLIGEAERHAESKHHVFLWLLTLHDVMESLATHQTTVQNRAANNAK